MILLSKARPGTVHDKRQLDEEQLVENIPDEVAVKGDLGFQGLQHEFVNIHVPHKKPKGKELSKQQKQQNRELSRQRVKCVACFPKGTCPCRHKALSISFHCLQKSCP